MYRSGWERRERRRHDRPPRDRHRDASRENVRRKPPFQVDARGSIADDDLRPRMPRRQERLDILFDRDAADVKLDRPAKRQNCRIARAIAAEDREIDAAPPWPGPRDPVFGQRRGNRRRRRQHRFGRRMEPANISPDPFGVRAGPCRDIIGKLGVIGGREGQAAPQAILRAARHNGPSVARWIASAPNASSRRPTTALRAKARRISG